MNDLVNLPNLPDGLEELNCSCNDLVNLSNIPNRLKKLDCYMNKLVHIQNLPPSLEYLYVSRNRLTEIPMLPTRLKILTCNNNNLQRLPELPDSTITIDASNNRLHELPTLPLELDLLECSGNNISTLSESISHLCRPNGRINLSGNPLSERTIQNIYTMINEVSYSGPIILFSTTPLLEPESSIRPLSKSVADWFSTQRKKEITAKFSAIAREENAEAFSAFLDRLRDTSSAKKDPMFRQHIVQWLTRLSTSPDLRKATFAVAIGATEICEDRVALTWNDMQKVELVHNIENGQYDNGLPELITTGREMFRLEQLEKIAREKAATVDTLDEIEVYLGFQTQLRTPLELPHTTKEMRFFDVSGITKSDLNAAEIRVKTAENQQFPEWFAQWSPWQKLLERTEPMLWERAYDKKMDIYENEYQNCINTELNASGLLGDIDAERTVGIKIMREIDNEIFISLAYDALANKKQTSLFNQYWNL
ncbi:hypothetical protein M2263_001454 [Providencia alcalifaciens]|nr:hypothetical protein [Providencia alcalifaciens]